MPRNAKVPAEEDSPVDRTNPDQWPQRAYRRKETLADMSETMASALVNCAGRGVDPEEFGTAEEVADKDSKVKWTTATRNRLERHGLIHLAKSRKGKLLWRATDDGRGVVAAHVPRFLAARPGALRYRTLKSGRQVVDESGPPSGDYTHRSAFAMRGEPEAA